MNAQELVKKWYCELVDSKTTDPWNVLCEKLQQALTYAKTERSKAAASNAPASTSRINRLGKLTNVSFVSPRGKFNVEFGTESMRIVNSKDIDTEVDYTKIGHILKLPKMDPVKKQQVREYMFVFCFTEPIPLRKSGSKYIVMQAKKDRLRLEVEFATGKQILEEEFYTVLDKLLQQLLPSRQIIRTLPETKNNLQKQFISTVSQSSIKCFWKTSDGVLYIIREGLLFMQPVQFIPAKDIASIQAGRGGSAASRTFDLHVELTSGELIEFKMIEREELAAVSDFVQIFHDLKSSDAQKKKLEETESDKRIEAKNEECDDSESEDEDYNSDASSDNSGYTDTDEEPLSGDAYSSNEEETSEDESCDESSPVFEDGEKPKQKLKTISATKDCAEMEQEKENDGGKSASKKRSSASSVSQPTLVDHGFFAKRVRTARDE